MTVIMRIEAKDKEKARALIVRRQESCRNFEYDYETEERLEEQEPSAFCELPVRSGCDSIMSYRLTYCGKSEDLENLEVVEDKSMYVQQYVKTASRKLYKMSNRFKELTFCPSCGGLPIQCDCRSRNEPPWSRPEVAYEPAPTRHRPRRAALGDEEDGEARDPEQVFTVRPGYIGGGMRAHNTTVHFGTTLGANAPLPAQPAPTVEQQRQGRRNREAIDRQVAEALQAGENLNDADFNAVLDAARRIEQEEPEPPEPPDVPNLTNEWV